MVQSKIKSHTPLSKLLKACCYLWGFSVWQIRFQFDRQSANEADTPVPLEIEAEDQLMCPSSR